MNMKNGLSSKTKKVAFGATVVLGSLGIGGTGLALLSGGTASAATAPATAHPNATKAQEFRKFLRTHTVDSTVTVKTKNGYETITVVRGTVGAISSTSITVNSLDGKSVTASIDSKTKFHNTTEQQLASGDKVGVLSYDGVARWVNAPKTATPSPSS
jgi:Zn-dependent alcohol dehydrogenase